MVHHQHAEWLRKADLPQVTPRSIIAGLAIGTIVLFSNFQFGLQTGWVSMMSLPSALLGFAAFKSLQPRLGYAFSDVENVFVQSLAVAVGTGPLAYGFVGVIPAIEKFLTPEEANTQDPIRFSTLQLIIWSLGLAFFGVFFAVLLRKQIIVREKLKFPSGSATATMIAVLHQSEVPESTAESTALEGQNDHEGLLQRRSSSEDSPYTSDDSTDDVDQTVELEHLSKKTYSNNIRILLSSFTISAFYSLASYFLPIVRNLPIFGENLAKNYLWTFQPSPAYIGQGIIMGLPTVTSMLFGAVLGWAVLGPMAQSLGWATGPVDDWKTGSQGWILWISLTIMVADTVVSFFVITGVSVYKMIMRNPNFHGRGYWNKLFKTESRYQPVNHGSNDVEIEDSEAVEGLKENDENEPDASPEHLVPNWVTIFGLVISFILCIIAVKAVFGSLCSVYPVVIAIFLALFLSILGVRALGETDLNPVSGIGKISQVIFALVVPRSHPGSVLINLVAGGITEAGAQQAGDLMQDLKTGHLIGASPRAQFVAQLIGSVWSALLSAVVYRLYDTVYDVPGSLFRIPTAVIWIDCSRLVTGEGIPPHAGGFALAFGLLFGVLATAKVVLHQSSRHAWAAAYIPSGVAVGIGIYNSPSFTLARFIGGFGAWYWLKRQRENKDAQLNMVVLSSGLVLGEGVFSIANLFMTALGVPHF